VYVEAETGQQPWRRANDRKEHAEEIKVATLNVRSLCQPMMHTYVEQYMEQRGVEIMCLQGRRVAQMSQYVVGSTLSVTSGHGRQEPEHAGVAFALGKRIRSCITGFTLSETGRMISVGVDAAPRLLIIISICIPQSASPEEERTATYEDPSMEIDRASRKGAIVTAGDFNARLHGVLLTDKRVIVPHVYGAGVGRVRRALRGYTETTNRDMLLDLCKSRGLLMMNTWFAGGDASKVTRARGPRRGWPEQADAEPGAGRGDRLFLRAQEVEAHGAGCTFANILDVPVGPLPS